MSFDMLLLLRASGMVLLLLILHFAIAIVVIVVARVPRLLCCYLRVTIASPAIVRSRSGCSYCCCECSIAIAIVRLHTWREGRVDVVDIDRGLLRSEINKQTKTR